MKTYMVNEIFWSPQGEGIRAGEMSVFIRLTGCNMQCRIEPGPLSPGGFDCDTEFASGRKLQAKEIMSQARALVNKPEFWWGEVPLRRPWIVFTGGEPALQLDEELVDAGRKAGFYLAIETNGSKDVSHLGLDWITVSPKVAEHAVRQMTADEIKYVRGYGQAIPKPTCKAKHQLLSPAFDGLATDQQTIQWCLKLIKENPEWRLSVQLHKIWNAR